MYRFSETGRCWRLIVIGGGSAAAIQVRQGDVPPQDTLVIGDRLGTGMEYLDNFTLQSYADELRLSRCQEAPRLGTTGQLRPSAAQFDAYVRESLLSSGATVRNARVPEVEGEQGKFLIHVLNGDGRMSYERAEAVVLATGSTPRIPPPRWADAGAVSHDVVHRERSRHQTSRWAGRTVLVVGSGNSAMQVASLVASEADEVVVLGNRYIGMFPTENPDKYSWRAPSQLACELVAKSAMECGQPGWHTTCVRHLVYDRLDVHDGEITWTYQAQNNQNPLGSRSLSGRCRHAQGRLIGAGGLAWEESRRVSETAVVWATGSEPVLPGGPLIKSLARDTDGSLLTDEAGRTSVDGVHALGACAGQRAVNETTPALVRRRLPLSELLAGRDVPVDAEVPA
ncbi:FAD-dependent oxidoreductase [Streptomyces durbertensis]|uniref:L-lysine N6-monooxygenase MbtG n=1 Tax=Streptomyces durbertensis TaxID=2448886 RepID=A0ABR6EFE1_9ACTN|nr:FAD-dependent oxidoreductase [Streptomyces durbertensis]MBB1244051.1 FAD-dependent oxidoreductase [Streptomyces durbertensis]